MDELRNKVWDCLYRLAEPQTLDAIADQIGEDPNAIQQAIDHPWFLITDGMVTIAYNK